LLVVEEEAEHGPGQIILLTAQVVGVKIEEISYFLIT
jgi:hypothetical protein